LASEKPNARDKKQRLWSSKRDRIVRVFNPTSGPGDVVKRLEEDVGLDSSSQFEAAELPMDSRERMEAIEAEKRNRADDE
jgi:hypothetical protein